MKKNYILTLVCAAALLLTGCGDSANSGQESNTTELTVYAAASLTEALTEIGKDYHEVNPSVMPVFTFDSSGTLKTQIEEGADCDLFISAAQKQMNALDASDTTGTNENGNDLILSSSRIDLLENKVVLCVSDPETVPVKSFDDLKQALTNKEILLAIGNEDVPVGQYTQKIFDYLKISLEEVSPSISYGSNAKEITIAVSESIVDCAVLYETDACTAGVEIVDKASPEMCGQVIYPAAVTNNALHEEEALRFLEYLTSPEASSVFEKYGFTPLYGIK